ncbi:hypothetical protein Cdeb_01711 [Caldibacillus debilis GB1]|uniref:Uncharacterized protein n=1 Tax=Caldibacillus debilis GB1 TaxID=1339248 RepID=A0A420VCX5_9BACI|nr:hypothetical protein Cdeb_01711 [Caldibacillus debilis GB1]
MEIPGGVLLKANVSAVRRKGEFEKAWKGLRGKRRIAWHGPVWWRPAAGSGIVLNGPFCGKAAAGLQVLFAPPAACLPSAYTEKIPGTAGGGLPFFLRPKENTAASGHKPSGLRAHCLGLHPFPWAGKLQQKRKRPARSAERFFRNRTVPGSAADFYKASEMPRIRIPNSTQAMTR